MKGFSQQVGYLKRERNYLPWAVALEAFDIILGLLKPDKETDSDVEEREEVYERFKTWVINLMMPYFCENGYADVSDATEEQKNLKKRMRKFSCLKLKHKPCMRFENLWAAMSIEPPQDEEYCPKMLRKIVHQSDVNIDVAMNVLERCTDQLIASPDREEIMAKVTSKVETVEEVKRLREWEEKNRYSPCPPDTQIKCYPGNTLHWAKRMVEQIGLKNDARINCRDMIFQTMKKVGGADEGKSMKNIENLFHQNFPRFRNPEDASSCRFLVHHI